MCVGVGGWAMCPPPPRLGCHELADAAVQGACCVWVCEQWGLGVWEVNWLPTFGERHTRCVCRVWCALLVGSCSVGPTPGYSVPSPLVFLTAVCLRGLTWGPVCWVPVRWPCLCVAVRFTLHPHPAPCTPPLAATHHNAHPNGWQPFGLSLRGTPPTWRPLFPVPTTGGCWGTSTQP